MGWRERNEQAELLQSKRVQNLIIPEQVGPGAVGLGDDRVGQADRLRALDVVLRVDPVPRPRLVFSEDRLGKLAVKSRVDHDPIIAPTARKEKKKPEDARAKGSDCEPRNHENLVQY